MEKPLVSIAVPLFNKAAHIEQCLQSLAAQTLDQIEVIIIDDGSTDGSGNIAQAFCNQDKRFVLYRQDNAGVSVALNRAITHAQGAYIARVDADDWVDPEMFKTLCEIAVSYDVPLVRCGYIREFTDSSTKRVPVAPVLEERTGHWCFHKLFGEIFIPLMSTCLGIYRLDVLREASISYPEELTNLEDIFFNARFYALDTPVVLAPECLYHYRQDATSLSQHTQLQLPEQLELFEDLMQQEVLSHYPELAASYAHYRQVAILTTAADMNRFGYNGMRALRNSGMYDAIRGDRAISELRSMRPLMFHLDRNHFGAAWLYSCALRSARAIRRKLRDRGDKSR